VSTYLRIGLGPEHYALEVGHVREVSEARDIVAVPGAGPHVLGVCNLRGEILPVVRLDGLLRVDAPPVRRIAVVEEAGRRAGLAISHAAEVEELERPGEEDAAAGLAGGLLRASVLHEGRLIGVLDVAALLDAVEGGAA
jgi:chemotaxis signal transduction protein